MTSLNRRGIRLIAALTLFFFSVSSLSWGSPAPDLSGLISFSNRNNSEIGWIPLTESIEIPDSIGTVRKRHALDGTRPGAVIHIQDAHSSLEAQENTRRILHHLSEQYGIDAVFLEGTFSTLRPQNAAIFKDQELNRRAAEIFMKNGLIGGPEAFLLDKLHAGESIPGHGVEDLRLYARNLSQFRIVHRFGGMNGRFLDEIRSQIISKSSRVFGKALKDFFREWVFYREICDEMFRHADALAGQAKISLQIDLRSPRSQVDWPQLTRLVRLQDLEKNIDHKKAAREKEDLDRWMEVREMPPALLERMWSLIQRPSDPSGDLRRTAERFYDLASSRGFAFEDYPEFRKALGRSMLLGEIQVDELAAEIGKMTDKVFDALAETQDEKLLLGIYSDYLTLRKLFALEMTRGDYETAKERGRELLPSVLVERLEGVDAGPMKSDLSGRVKLPEFIFRKAFAFYALAVKREDAIFERVAGQMKALENGVAVLIAGGFHSEGIAEAVKQRGIPYLEITPRITSLKETTNYMDWITFRGIPDTQSASIRSMSLTNDLAENMTVAPAVGPATIFYLDTAAADLGVTTLDQLDLDALHGNHLTAGLHQGRIRFARSEMRIAGVVPAGQDPIDIWKYLPRELMGKKITGRELMGHLLAFQRQQGQTIPQREIARLIEALGAGDAGVSFVRKMAQEFWRGYAGFFSSWLERRQKPVFDFPNSRQGIFKFWNKVFGNAWGLATRAPDFYDQIIFFEIMTGHDVSEKKVRALMREWAEARKSIYAYFTQDFIDKLVEQAWQEVLKSRSEFREQPADPYDHLEAFIYRVLERYSNVHRGAGYHSDMMTELYEWARRTVLGYFGYSPDRYTVIFASPFNYNALKKAGIAIYDELNSNSFGLPFGIHAIVVSRGETKWPPITGGGIVKGGYSVTTNGVYFADSPERFEPGTPNIVGAIAFAYALSMIKSSGNTITFNPSSSESGVSGIIEDPVESGMDLLTRLRETMIGRGEMGPAAGLLTNYVNLDNAASTPAFSLVAQAAMRAMRLSQSSREELEARAREVIHDYFGAPVEDYEIVFVQNTTEALNLMARNAALVGDAGPGQVLVNTEAEHNSNELPWRNVPGSVHERVKVDAGGNVNIADLERALRWYNKTPRVTDAPTIRLVAVTGASNVTGAVNDLRAIADIVHKPEYFHDGKNSPVLLVDAAQLAAHQPVHMAELGIDALAFSGHKAYAPFGTGALIVRRGILTDQVRAQVEGPPNLAGIAATAQALLALKRVGLELIAREEQELLDYAWREIGKIRGLTIFGGKAGAVGIISFLLEKWGPFRIASYLSSVFGIGVRAGCFCAHVFVIQVLRKYGLTRASFGFYNTTDEIDRLADALKSASKIPEPHWWDPNRSHAKFYQNELSLHLGELTALPPEIFARPRSELRGSGESAGEDAEKNEMLRILRRIIPLLQGPYSKKLEEIHKLVKFDDYNAAHDALRKFRLDPEWHRAVSLAGFFDRGEAEEIRLPEVDRQLAGIEFGLRRRLELFERLIPGSRDTDYRLREMLIPIGSTARNLTYGPDGNILVTDGYSQRYIRTGEIPEIVWRIGYKYGYDAVIDANNNVVLNNLEGPIRILDTRDGMILYVIDPPEHQGEIRKKMAADPYGDVLISTGTVVRRLSARDYSYPEPSMEGFSNVTGFANGPDHEIFILNSDSEDSEYLEEGSIKYQPGIYVMREWGNVERLEISEQVGAPVSIAVNQAGRLFAAYGGYDEAPVIRIFNIETGQMEAEINDFPQGQHDPGLAKNPEGHIVLTLRDPEVFGHGHVYMLEALNKSGEIKWREVRAPHESGSDREIQKSYQSLSGLFDEVFDMTYYVGMTSRAARQPRLSLPPGKSAGEVVANELQNLRALQVRMKGIQERWEQISQDLDPENPAPELQAELNWLKAEANQINIRARATLETFQAALFQFDPNAYFAEFYPMNGRPKDKESPILRALVHIAQNPAEDRESDTALKEQVLEILDPVRFKAVIFYLLNNEFIAPGEVFTAEKIAKELGIGTDLVFFVLLPYSDNDTGLVREGIAELTDNPPTASMHLGSDPAPRGIRVFRKMRGRDFGAWTGAKHPKLDELMNHLRDRESRSELRSGAAEELWRLSKVAAKGVGYSLKWKYEKFSGNFETVRRHDRAMSAIAEAQTGKTENLVAFAAEEPSILEEILFRLPDDDYFREAAQFYPDLNREVIRATAGRHLDPLLVRGFDPADGMIRLLKDWGRDHTGFAIGALALGLFSVVMVIVIQLYLASARARSEQYRLSKSRNDIAAVQLAFDRRDADTIEEIEQRAVRRHETITVQIREAEENQWDHVRNETEDPLAVARRYSAFDAMTFSSAGLGKNQVTDDPARRAGAVPPVIWQGWINSAEQAALREDFEGTLALGLQMLRQEIQRQSQAAQNYEEHIDRFAGIVPLVYGREMRGDVQWARDRLDEFNAREIQRESDLLEKSNAAMRRRTDSRLYEADQHYKVQRDRRDRLIAWYNEKMEPLIKLTASIESDYQSMSAALTAETTARMMADANRHVAVTKSEEIPDGKGGTTTRTWTEYEDHSAPYELAATAASALAESYARGINRKVKELHGQLSLLEHDPLIRQEKMTDQIPHGVPREAGRPLGLAGLLFFGGDMQRFFNFRAHWTGNAGESEFRERVAGPVRAMAGAFRARRDDAVQTIERAIDELLDRQMDQARPGFSPDDILKFRPILEQDDAPARSELRAGGETSIGVADYAAGLHGAENMILAIAKEKSINRLAYEKTQLELLIRTYLTDEALSNSEKRQLAVNALRRLFKVTHIRQNLARVVLTPYSLKTPLRRQESAALAILEAYGSYRADPKVKVFLQGWAKNRREPGTPEPGTIENAIQSILRSPEESLPLPDQKQDIETFLGAGSSGVESVYSALGRLQTALAVFMTRLDDLYRYADEDLARPGFMRQADDIYQATWGEMETELRQTNVFSDGQWQWIADKAGPVVRLKDPPQDPVRPWSQVNLREREAAWSSLGRIIPEAVTSEIFARSELRGFEDDDDLHFQLETDEFKVLLGFYILERHQLRRAFGDVLVRFFIERGRANLQLVFQTFPQFEGQPAKLQKELREFARNTNPTWFNRNIDNLLVWANRDEQMKFRLIANQIVKNAKDYKGTVRAELRKNTNPYPLRETEDAPTAEGLSASVGRPELRGEGAGQIFTQAFEGWKIAVTGMIPLVSVNRGTFALVTERSIKGNTAGEIIEAFRLAGFQVFRTEEPVILDDGTVGLLGIEPGPAIPLFLGRDSTDAIEVSKAVALKVGQERGEGLIFVADSTDDAVQKITAISSPSEGRLEMRSESVLEIDSDFEQTVNLPYQAQKKLINEVIADRLRRSGKNREAQVFLERCKSARIAYERIPPERRTQQDMIDFYASFKDYLTEEDFKALSDSWDLNPNYLRVLSAIKEMTGVRNIKLRFVVRGFSQPFEMFLRRKDVTRELSQQGVLTDEIQVVGNRLVMDGGVFTGVINPPVVADKFDFVMPDRIYLGDQDDAGYGLNFFIDVNAPGFVKSARSVVEGYLEARKKHEAVTVARGTGKRPGGRSELRIDAVVDGGFLHSDTLLGLRPDIRERFPVAYGASFEAMVHTAGAADYIFSQRISTWPELIQVLLDYYSPDEAAMLSAERQGRQRFREAALKVMEPGYEWLVDWDEHSEPVELYYTLRKADFRPEDFRSMVVLDPNDRFSLLAENQSPAWADDFRTGLRLLAAETGVKGIERQIRVIAAGRTAQEIVRQVQSMLRRPASGEVIRRAFADSRDDILDRVGFRGAHLLKNPDALKDIVGIHLAAALLKQKDFQGLERIDVTAWMKEHGYTTEGIVRNIMLAISAVEKISRAA